MKLGVYVDRRPQLNFYTKMLIVICLVFWGPILGLADPVEEAPKEGYAILLSEMVLSGPKVCYPECAPDLSCEKHTCQQIDGMNVCLDSNIQTPYTACAGANPCAEALACLQGESAQKLPDFIAHKEEKGFAVYVFGPEDWGGGLGADAATNIRTMLQIKTPELNLKYLLLIGDPTPDSDLPMKELWPRNNATEWWAVNYAVPSDYFYGELDGDWDLDGDGKYGEFGNPNLTNLDISGDFAPGGSELLGVNRGYELKVGRIPVYSEVGMSALDHILTKTINYQRASYDSIGWRKGALLAAEGGNRFFFGELIRDQILSPNNFASYRVYDADCWNETDLDANCMSSLPTLPDAMECSVDNVIQGWNSLVPGAVFWLSHGSSQSAIPIMSTYAAETYLDDDYPVFTFQASCNNSTPEAVNNLSYSLLVNGGIATIGATRESHGPGAPWPSLSGGSDNASMGWEYARHIIELQENAGTAFFELRKDNGFGKWWLWQNYAAFNLFGDPDVSLYDFLPVHSIDPIADQELAEGESLELVLVATDDQGSPVALEVSPLEDWMSFDPMTGEFLADADYDHAGVYTLSVQSTGYGEKAVQAFNLEVFNTNRAPVLSIETEAFVTAGQSIEVPFSADDADGDDVVVSNSPTAEFDWVTIGEGILDISPGSAVRGEYFYTLVADDGESSVDMTISITVEAPPEDASPAADITETITTDDVVATADTVETVDTIAEEVVMGADSGGQAVSKSSSGCTAGSEPTSPWSSFLILFVVTLGLVYRRSRFLV